jgi:hypothetical protein
LELELVLASASELALGSESVLALERALALA